MDRFIIGAAFGKVVSSLVSDVMMPPIGYLLGGVDFSNLAINIKEASGSVPAVTVKYGSFINTLIDFLIVAATIFIVVKGFNTLQRMHKSEEAEPVTRDCPECLMQIPAKAKRCGHCTSPINGKGS